MMQSFWRLFLRGSQMQSQDLLLLVNSWLQMTLQCRACWMTFRSIGQSTFIKLSCHVTHFWPAAAHLALHFLVAQIF